MEMMRSAAVAASLLITGVLLGGGLAAQEAAPANLRGEILSVSADGLTLGVRAAQGDERILRLKPSAAIIAVIPATLADIKPGLFIGAAARPGPDGALHALEVHIFPEALRGTAEGSRAYDLAPQSTMTNGAISAMVNGVTGSKLTVMYKGGEQTILIDETTPVVAFVPGVPGDLRKDASVTARGVTKAADGAYDVTRFVVVGRDGLKLPM